MNIKKVNIKKARAIVAAYIKPWSTDKICQVIAFCEDGKMDAFHTCSCLIGVDSSSVLHESEDECAEGPHYRLRRWYYEPAVEAEFAYIKFGDQRTRDRELIAILRDELAARESVLALQQVQQPEAVIA